MPSRLGARDAHLRPARKDECLTIARLYSISSDGVTDYVWTKRAKPGQDILDVGRRRYEREDSVFSYRNCTIVEVEGGIAGMLVAFPLRCDPDEVEDDPVLKPYAELEEDCSYYISSIALFPEYRNRGLGGRLLAAAEADATRAGCHSMSLIVFDQNAGAVRFYKRHGYVEQRRAAVMPHPLIHFTGDALLMVKAFPA